MVQQTGGGVRDILNGAILQCLEAITLGMPLEVWKTRMGRYRHESTLQALKGVYERGGILGFWSGTSAKMVESATKGAVLLFSKEHINTMCLNASISPTISGFIAGAGGGVCQVSVMGPCTFLVTAAVTGDKSISTSQRISNIISTKGIKGFYPGGTAIAWRQATNWASRQGFTEYIRQLVIRTNHKEEFNQGVKSIKLTKGEEVMSGILGGAISCWNHPFEVARIEMQARADKGEPKLSLTKVLATVYQQQGVGGLFKGIIPRIGLGIWQTLFMVTGAKLIKEHFLK